MDREEFLTWAQQMLAVQLALPHVTRQSNNVQWGFSDPAVAVVRGPRDGVGIGVVANIQPPEVRVHLFTYDTIVRTAWENAGPCYIDAPYALPLIFRPGPNGNVSYLEFSCPVGTTNDFAAWCAPIFGYVAFFVMARAQGLLP